MLSVVIATLNDEARLAAGLTSLVGAAVDGLVRQVIVADGGSSDATLAIAEDAGCQVVASAGGVGARLAAGCAEARSAWLMTFPAGSRLTPGWEEAVTRFIEAEEGRAARLRPGRGWLTSGAEGVLAPRLLYEARGGYREVSSPQRDLARRLGARAALRLLVSDPVARR